MPCLMRMQSILVLDAEAGITCCWKLHMPEIAEAGQVGRLNQFRGQVFRLPHQKQLTVWLHVKSQS